MSSLYIESSKAARGPKGDMPSPQFFRPLGYQAWMGVRLTKATEASQGFFINFAVPPNPNGEDENHDFLFMNPVNDPVIIENNELSIIFQLKVERGSDLIRCHRQQLTNLGLYLLLGFFVELFAVPRGDIFVNLDFIPARRLGHGS